MVLESELRAVCKLVKVSLVAPPAVATMVVTSPDNGLRIGATMLRTPLMIGGEIGQSSFSLVGFLLFFLKKRDWIVGWMGLKLEYELWAVFFFF